MTQVVPWAESFSTRVGIQADSAKLADLDRLYERVKAEAGRIDVLFVNAGGGSMLALGEITEEQYDDTFDRNVKGVLFTVQKALPLLGPGSSVILTGSTAGVVCLAVGLGLSFAGLLWLERIADRVLGR